MPDNLPGFEYTGTNVTEWPRLVPTASLAAGQRGATPDDIIALSDLSSRAAALRARSATLSATRLADLNVRAQNLRARARQLSQTSF